MLSPKELIENYLKTLNGELKTPDLVSRYVSNQQLLQHIATTEAAFPRYELLPQDLIGEENKVAVRGIFRGTQTGPFNGIPPTYRAITADMIIIYEVAEEKIVNFWMQFDSLSWMRQLQDSPLAMAGLPDLVSRLLAL